MRVSKMVVSVLMVVVVLGIGAGVLWYITVPHTPEAQFTYAEKLEALLRSGALTKSVKEIEPQIGQTEEQYRRVGTRFGKSQKAAEGIKHIAKLEEEVAKSDEKALAALDELLKDYPEEENAGFALRDQARLIRKKADELKAGKTADAAAKYKDAIAKLEEYRKRFEKGKDGDAALMEIGRIWQDGLGDPPIRAIETFEKFLNTPEYKLSEYTPEALYRLAQLYEMAKEFGRAMELYTRLTEEYPKSLWTDKAMFAKAKILEDQMKDHEQAAKEFEKLQKDFPDSPLSGQARGEGRKAKNEQAQEEGESYGKSRYGGQIPYDTIRDKPLPPAGMFKQFAEQKLDAEKYDLNVEFAPADNRMTVKGTLKLANRGEEKTELLLMLGQSFNIGTLTIDGKESPVEHKGEAVKIVLPGPLKKDAEATIGFEYTGQYAEATQDMGEIMGGPPKKEAEPETAPATEPAATKPKRNMNIGHNPQIALGEFGYGLSGGAWYPVTIIGDVFDAHITMKTPAKMEAVSNGELKKRERATKEGEQGVFEFETKNPVFGLYFAYGPYTVQEKQVGPIHFYTYLRESNAPKHEAYVEVTNRILSFYAGRYVPFPFEKMAIVETPLPPFLGGVGPASLMFLHERMVARPDVPENLLAHELAHQWFGNLIPINIADPNYNQWLSEGFATYCDALYTEHKDGHDAFVKHIQRYGQLYFTFMLTASRGQGAIKDTYPDSGLYRPVVYEKGALVLHMLRKVMGDEKFFRLMHDYLETYRNKPSTVDDFRRMASGIQGDDLSWFFAEWIDQSMFAHYKLAVAITAKEGSSDPVKVKMEITQPDDLVKMPVDITLIGAKPTERQVMANVMLDKKEQTVEATTPFVPVKVVLDEDFWVLRHPGSDNIWPTPVALAATQAAEAK